MLFLNVHSQSLDLLIKLSLQSVQRHVIHLSGTEFYIATCNMHSALKPMSTYWIEFFHCNWSIVQEAFVDGTKASFSKASATVGCGPVIKVPSSHHQLTVQETGEP